MFKVPTTIVLGAGASHSYGYPVGNDLISQMIQLSTPTADEKKHLASGFKFQDSDRRAAIHLGESLRFYHPISIDSFLQHYHDNRILVDQAKKLITHILLSTNNIDLFSYGANLKGHGISKSDDSPTHWYRFLWDAIVSEQTPVELSEPDHKLRFDIITFNYDNSLEYFLASRIYSKHSMFKDDQKAQFLLNLRKRIHHVYGSLNDHIMIPTKNGIIENISYPELQNGDEYGRIESSYSNIKLIGERSAADFADIQAALKDKSQIIFLGFGFEETNIGPNVLDLENAFLTREVSRHVNGHVLPLVKYTNLGDSEKINRKLKAILFKPLDEGDRRGYVTRNSGEGLIKSTKKVYQALDEDFRINDF